MQEAPDVAGVLRRQQITLMNDEGQVQGKKRVSQWTAEFTKRVHDHVRKTMRHPPSTIIESGFQESAFCSFSSV